MSLYQVFKVHTTRKKKVDPDLLMKLWKLSDQKVIVCQFIYTIHLSWCFGMGRQWCFLWDHGGFRVFQHQTPSPKWPSWHWSNSNSHPGSQPTHPHKEKTKKKMTIEKALYMILQQPIRAKLYWWLLNLFFKNREATLLCFFFCYNGVVIRLFVHSGMYSFLFPPFFFFN